MADYGGFAAIVQEAKALDAANRQSEEIACPECGRRLVINDKRERNCPAGHYRV